MKITKLLKPNRMLYITKTASPFYSGINKDKLKSLHGRRKKLKYTRSANGNRTVNRSVKEMIIEDLKEE